jgi:hypothetical protein
VCQVGVFSTAARELGLSDSTTYSRRSIQLFDHSNFSADDPIAYLNSLEIKHDIYMAEVAINASVRRAA